MRASSSRPGGRPCGSSPSPRMHRRCKSTKCGWPTWQGTMAKRDERATNALNVELSRISAALSIMAGIVQGMPDNDTKTQLQKLIAQGERGYETAFELTRIIAQHASAI